MIITPIINDHYHCADTCIISVARAAKRDYQLLFYNYFTFDYVQCHGRFMADNFHLFSNENFPIARKYCGIEITECFGDSVPKTFQKVKEMITDCVAIIITTNVYYCPWAGPAIYQKVSNPHFYLITDYSLKTFRCVDSFFTPYELLVKENDLYLDNSYYCIINITDQPVLSLFDQYTLMLDGINQYTDAKIDDFHDFKRDMLALDVEKEKNVPDSVSETALLRCLKQLERNRLCYLELLEFMNQTQGANFDSSIDDLRNICTQWRKLWAILSKCFFKGSILTKRDVLGKLIDDIQLKECLLRSNIILQLKNSANELNGK